MLTKKVVIKISQNALVCSKSTIETAEEILKYVKS